MAELQIPDSETSDHSMILISDDEDNDRQSPQALAILSSRSSSESESPEEQLHLEQAESRDQREPNVLDFEIRPPPPASPGEYTKFPPSTVVEKVLDEIERPGGEIVYLIEYEDALEEEVSIRSSISAISLLRTLGREAPFYMHLRQLSICFSSRRISRPTRRTSNTSVRRRYPVSLVSQIDLRK